MFNKATQYRLSDLPNEHIIEHNQQIKIKLPIKNKKKTKDIGVNTESIPATVEKDNVYQSHPEDYESDSTIQTDVHDNSFHLSQEEGSETENDEMLQIGDTSHSQSIFMVYWSSIISLLNFFALLVMLQP